MVFGACSLLIVLGFRSAAVYFEVGFASLVFVVCILCCSVDCCA